MDKGLILKIGDLFCINDKSIGEIFVLRVVVVEYFLLIMKVDFDVIEGCY